LLCSGTEPLEFGNFVVPDLLGFGVVPDLFGVGVDPGSFGVDVSSKMSFSIFYLILKLF